MKTSEKYRAAPRTCKEFTAAVSLCACFVCSHSWSLQLELTCKPAALSPDDMDGFKMRI